MMLGSHGREGGEGGMKKERERKMMEKIMLKINGREENLRLQQGASYYVEER